MRIGVQVATPLDALTVGDAVRGSLSQQLKRRRLGHQYAKPIAKLKQPELKTVDPTDFVDGDGKIPIAIPNYALGKDNILFTGKVDLTSNDKEEDIRSKLVEVFSSRITGPSVKISLFDKWTF